MAMAEPVTLAVPEGRGEIGWINGSADDVGTACLSWPQGSTDLLPGHSLSGSIWISTDE